MRSVSTRIRCVPTRLRHARAGLGCVRARLGRVLARLRYTRARLRRGGARLRRGGVGDIAPCRRRARAPLPLPVRRWWLATFPFRAPGRLRCRFDRGPTAGRFHVGRIDLGRGGERRRVAIGIIHRCRRDGHVWRRAFARRRDDVALARGFAGRSFAQRGGYVGCRTAHAGCCPIHARRRIRSAGFPDRAWHRSPVRLRRRRHHRFRDVRFRDVRLGGVRLDNVRPGGVRLGAFRDCGSVVQGRRAVGSRHGRNGNDLRDRIPALALRRGWNGRGVRDGRLFLVRNGRDVRRGRNGNLGNSGRWSASRVVVRLRRCRGVRNRWNVGRRRHGGGPGREAAHGLGWRRGMGHARRQRESLRQGLAQSRLDPLRRVLRRRPARKRHASVDDLRRAVPENGRFRDRPLHRLRKACRRTGRDALPVVHRRREALFRRGDDALAHHLRRHEPRQARSVRAAHQRPGKGRDGCWLDGKIVHRREVAGRQHVVVAHGRRPPPHRQAALVHAHRAGCEPRQQRHAGGQLRFEARRSAGTQNAAVHHADARDRLTREVRKLAAQRRIGHGTGQDHGAATVFQHRFVGSFHAGRSDAYAHGHGAGRRAGGEKIVARACGGAIHDQFAVAQCDAAFREPPQDPERLLDHGLELRRGVRGDQKPVADGAAGQKRRHAFAQPVARRKVGHEALQGHRGGTDPCAEAVRLDRGRAHVGEVGVRHGGHQILQIARRAQGARKCQTLTLQPCRAIVRSAQKGEGAVGALREVVRRAGGHLQAAANPHARQGRLRAASQDVARVGGRRETLQHHRVAVARDGEPVGRDRRWLQGRHIRVRILQPAVALDAGRAAPNR